MNAELFVLIGTINDRITGAANLLRPYDDRIVYLVSHQITEPLDEGALGAVDMIKGRSDVHYDVIEGTGVARNRNHALDMLEPDAVCLILDDDVTLLPNVFDSVMLAFASHPDADFISFKILNMQGKDFKRYPKHETWHTVSTLTGIGTTEMAFRSSFVVEKRLRFDERFGPGAPFYPTGEDFIFAMDLYRSGARMLFCPVPIVRHPQTSTGSSLDERVVFGRGAVFARVFGIGAPLADLYFAVKHRKRYRRSYAFVPYFFIMLKGSMAYWKTRTEAMP